MSREKIKENSPISFLNTFTLIALNPELPEVEIELQEKRKEFEKSDAYIKIKGDGDLICDTIMKLSPNPICSRHYNSPLKAFCIREWKRLSNSFSDSRCLCFSVSTF